MPQDTLPPGGIKYSIPTFAKMVNNLNEEKPYLMLVVVLNYMDKVGLLFNTVY